MKRTLSACLAVIAVFALCLSLAGCGGSSGSSASSEASASSSSETAKSAAGDSGTSAASVAASSSSASSSSAPSGAAAEINKTIVDDDLCTIKVLDAFEDEGVVGYHVEVSNKSDRDLTFTTGGRSGSNTIDGKEVSFIFYEEVGAGQVAQTEFDYWESDLGGGVEMLVNVKGAINVNDMSIPDTIATYEFEL